MLVGRVTDGGMGGSGDAGGAGGPGMGVVGVPTLLDAVACNANQIIILIPAILLQSFISVSCSR